MKEKLQTLINFSYRDDFSSMRDLLNNEPLLFLYNHHKLKQEKFLLEYLFLHVFSFYKLKPASKKETIITEMINNNIDFLITNQIFNTDVYIDDYLIEGNLFLYNISKTIINFNNVVEKPISNDIIKKLLEEGDPNTIMSHNEKEEVLLFSLLYSQSLDTNYIVPFFNQYLDCDLLERKEATSTTFNPQTESYNTLLGVLFETLSNRVDELSTMLELILFLFKKKSKLLNPYKNIEDFNIYKMFKYTKNLESEKSTNTTIINFIIKQIEKNYSRSLWKSFNKNELSILSQVNSDFYLKWFSYR